MLVPAYNSMIVPARSTSARGCRALLSHLSHLFHPFLSSLSPASMLFKARLDYESSLPRHLFESFVFRDAQMTVRHTYPMKVIPSTFSFKFSSKDLVESLVCWWCWGVPTMAATLQIPRMTELSDCFREAQGGKNALKSCEGITWGVACVCVRSFLKMTRHHLRHDICLFGGAKACRKTMVH